VSFGFSSLDFSFEIELVSVWWNYSCLHLFSCFRTCCAFSDWATAVATRFVERRPRVLPSRKVFNRAVCAQILENTAERSGQILGADLGRQILQATLDLPKRKELSYGQLMMFPRLQLLDLVTRRLGQNQPLRGVAVIGIQHLLETTGSLLESIVQMGVQPADIFIAGKSYSVSPAVAERVKGAGINVIAPPSIRTWGGCTEQLAGTATQLWSVLRRSLHTGIRAVVVLDDGGFTLKSSASRSLALPLTGVEQTTSGISAVESAPPPFTVVDVAGSAAKILLESRLIEQAVLRRIRKLEIWNSKEAVFGVAGVGNIGGALVEGLRSEKRNLLVYDSNPDAELDWGVERCSRLQKLFESADVIFGCAGQDILAQHNWWRNLKGAKVLASCSSRDVEFHTLLREYATANPGPPSDPLATVSLKLPRGRLEILRGGCPVNFDGSPEGVPAQDIQLTLALLLGGVVQAAEIGRDPSDKGPKVRMLDPQLQEMLASEWIRERGDEHPFARQRAGVFQDIRKIRFYSRPTVGAIAKVS